MRNIHRINRYGTMFHPIDIVSWIGHLSPRSDYVFEYPVRMPLRQADPESLNLLTSSRIYPIEHFISFLLQQL